MSKSSSVGTPGIRSPTLSPRGLAMWLCSGLLFQKAVVDVVRLGLRMRTGMLTTVGDAEAFQDFYLANAQRLVVFFTRRTLNAEVALDLTAETFAVALQRRGQFRGVTSAEA